MLEDIQNINNILYFSDLLEQSQKRNLIFKNNDVNIVNMYFSDFIDIYNVECVLSLANSYGLMDGGYDLAITDYFGWKLWRIVS